jgi:hypothetical protein
MSAKKKTRKIRFQGETYYVKVSSERYKKAPGKIQPTSKKNLIPNLIPGDSLQKEK